MCAGRYHRSIQTAHFILILLSILLSILFLGNSLNNMSILFLFSVVRWHLFLDNAIKAKNKVKVINRQNKHKPIKMGKNDKTDRKDTKTVNFSITRGTQRSITPHTTHCSILDATFLATHLDDDKSSPKKKKERKSPTSPELR